MGVWNLSCSYRVFSWRLTSGGISNNWLLFKSNRLLFSLLFSGNLGRGNKSYDRERQSHDRGNHPVPLPLGKTMTSVLYCTYSRVAHIRNHFFGFSLLFYPLFSQFLMKWFLICVTLLYISMFVLWDIMTFPRHLNIHMSILVVE